MMVSERTYMYCDKPYKDTYESDECYSLDCVNEICTMTLSKEGSNPEDSVIFFLYIYNCNYRINYYLWFLFL